MADLGPLRFNVVVYVWMGNILIEYFSSVFTLKVMEAREFREANSDVLKARMDAEKIHEDVTGTGGLEL